MRCSLCTLGLSYDISVDREFQEEYFASLYFFSKKCVFLKKICKTWISRHVLSCTAQSLEREMNFFWGEGGSGDLNEQIYELKLYLPYLVPYLFLIWLDYFYEPHFSILNWVIDGIYTIHRLLGWTLFCAGREKNDNRRPKFTVYHE